MGRDDLPLLAAWLGRPHVRRWYGEPGSLDDVVAYYGPSIEEQEPTDHYVVELEGRAVGMLQTYVVADHPEYAAVIGIRDRHTAGADILIGEEELTGFGLGTEILMRFVRDVVFARPEMIRCSPTRISATSRPCVRSRRPASSGSRSSLTRKTAASTRSSSSPAEPGRQGTQRAPR